MDWDDLRVFLAVARSDSLTGAGKVLRLDPATVGRRIARLEEACATALFVKSPQGYALTEGGQRLLVHAVTVEQGVQGASDALQGDTERLSGQIRIGAPDGCANFLLPQVCARLCDENPGLEVQIIALPRVFNLSRREADMAVAVSRPSAGRVMVQRLADYQLHLAASEEYLHRNPPINTPADLRNHRLVGYIPDMIFDKELDYLAEVGAGTVALASNSVSVQFNWLRAGAGIGVVHDFAVPFAPELRRVMIDRISLRRSFWLIRHADDRRLDRLSRFAEAFVGEFRRELARLEALA
jgi:DNA-binding transcriptional LysR family regulator